MQINLGNSMKFYFLIKQFKLNYLDEMTALAPKIVQGQTNVIKYNSDFFFFTWHKPCHWIHFTALDLMERTGYTLEPGDL